MAYIKKKYRDIIEQIDRELKLPKGWKQFIKKETKKDNLIIKSKGICTCGNCKTEFKSKKKINEIEKCPKCKREYLIKRSTYKWHTFEPRRIVLLDKLNENWIIRLFEFESRYYNGEIQNTNAVEYGRVILNDELNFVNNRLYCSMWGYETINKYCNIRKWREYYSGNSRLSVSGKLFHSNLKKLFKDTEYQYSQLWLLAQKEDNVDIRYYLKNNLPSTEILIKMGLFKLALCPKTFNIQGSFEKRFGINKEYYKFMKKHNIDIDELNILKLYKKKDIEGIKYLKRFSLDNLKEIVKYMSLEKFIHYAKEIIGFDISIYLDYLRFAEELKLDLKNKKYLFPDNLKEMHDEYARQIEIKKNKKIQRKINNRYKELEKNSYSNKNYMIIPAKSIRQLEDESAQQNHCVRSYAERYSKGECDIYFMRTLKEPKKSLVTVEVRNSKIIQSRAKDNEDPNKVQTRFLEKWENEVLNAA